MKNYFEVLKNVGTVTPVYANISKCIGFLASGFLSQLIYYSAAFNKNTFHKTDAEISDEVGFTIKEIRTARAYLIELGFISYERKGIPARGYYTIFPEKINAFLDNKLCQIGELAKPKGRTCKDESANLQSQKGELLHNIQHNKQHNIHQNIHNNREGKIENFAPTQTTENTNFENFEVPFFENGKQQPINEHTAKQQKPKRNNVAPPQSVKNTLTPTMDEVLEEALKKGLNPETAKYEASQFFNYYDSVGWQYGKGRKITRWRSAFAGWLNRAEQWAKTDKRKTSNSQPDQRQQAADRNYDEIADLTITSLLNQYQNGNYR
jgi:hypothetical protein